MIWLSGDTHGLLDISKLEVHFDELAAAGVEVTKDDYLIILGDAGVCWSGGDRDRQVHETLQDLPCTVLWVDGNHENFDLIEQYDVTIWHGGKVQFIKDDIIHLCRGQIFEIEGHTFFTFGGGFSIDKYARRAGISWWPQEMPSYNEYDEGLDNLEAAGNRVDFILTHSCPSFIARQLVPRLFPGEEQLQMYFDKLSRTVDFDQWFFGHFHVDDDVEGKYHALYENVIDLDEFL